MPQLHRYLTSDCQRWTHQSWELWHTFSKSELLWRLYQQRVSYNLLFALFSAFHLCDQLHLGESWYSDLYDNLQLYARVLCNTCISTLMINNHPSTYLLHLHLPRHPCWYGNQFYTLFNWNFDFHSTTINHYLFHHPSREDGSDSSIWNCSSQDTRCGIFYSF